MSNPQVRSVLENASKNFIENISTDRIRSLADSVIDNSMSRLIELANGHAAAIWIPELKDDEEVLTIAYNVGGKGSEVEGVISQPLDKGLVSKSFNEKETVCHQGFFKHKEQSNTVDQQLGQMTAHQIAGPFQMFNETVGAFTVIQTWATGIEQSSDWGFTDSHIQQFEDGVQILQRLFELNAIRSLD